MIQAAELRIGNNIILSGRVVTVSGILFNDVYVGDGHASPTPADIFEPIALTPEILERAGFTTTSVPSQFELQLNDDDTLVANPFISGGYVVQLCCKGNWAGHKPKYVHELQNLYYVLTGDELKIDLWYRSMN